MPEEPVPEMASASAVSGARNVAPSRDRMSSRIAIMSGSRWLRTGAAIARMMREATGLGPGPRSRRSVCGSMQQRPYLLETIRRERRERRARIAARIAGKLHRRLQPRDTETRRHRARDRRQPLLHRERLGVTLCPRERKQLETELRQH